MIHSLFKSILSLLAGCLIHIQHNYQNIYQIKMNYSIYWIIYLLTSSILILTLSKEIIIHDTFLFINSPFSFLIRAIWIKLKVITIKNLSFIIIITGYLLFILSMIEGFLGHLLCWGQMSYWGITVMIWSCSSNGIIIILYLLWNSTFEVILGLTLSFI